MISIPRCQNTRCLLLIEANQEYVEFVVDRHFTRRYHVKCAATPEVLARERGRKNYRVTASRPTPERSPPRGQAEASAPTAQLLQVEPDPTLAEASRAIGERQAQLMKQGLEAKAALRQALAENERYARIYTRVSAPPAPAVVA